MLVNVYPTNCAPSCPQAIPYVRASATHVWAAGDCCTLVKTQSGSGGDTHLGCPTGPGTHAAPVVSNAAVDAGG